MQQFESIEASLQVLQEASARLERQSRLLDLADEAILVCDLEDRVRYWNLAAEKCYGWSQVEALGKQTHSLLETVFPQPLEEIRATLFQTGSWEGELKHVTKGGSKIVVASRWSLEKDEHGDPAGVLEINHDITERQRTEETLIEAEAVRQQAAVELQGANEKLREQGQVLNLAQVLVRDMESRIVQWNLGAEQLYGFSKEEALGRISHELFQTEFPKSRADVDEVLRRTGRWEGELVHRKRDGERLVVTSQQIIYHDRSGRPVRILETNADITEQRRIQETVRKMEEAARLRLHESEERLAGIIGSAKDAIISVDAHHRIILLNAAAEEMFGYACSDILGQQLNRLIPSRFRTVHSKHMTEFSQSHLTRRKMGALDGLYGLRSNGEEFPIEASISHAITNGQQIFTAIIRDITERQINAKLQLENLRLQQRNLVIEEASRIKDDFLGTMSHELRTPLNGIIGFAEFLADGKPGAVNSKQKDYLEEILNSGKRLLQLVSDILDFTKVNAGKMELASDRFLLPQVVKDACAAVEWMAQKNSIHITIKISSEIGEIALDRKRFIQIQYNLLSNAVKFSNVGGTVEVSATLHKTDYFKLVVTDNGIGIKEEDFGRIFGEFEQLDSSTTRKTRKYEGTGLGLALTRKIVELQGGQLSVASVFGKGSGFTVLLPLVAPTQKHATYAPDSATEQLS